MKKTKRTICIVTPGYISTTPRVVKEADALENSGHEVVVVCSQGGLDVLREFDAGIFSTRPWRAEVVRWSSGRVGERLLHHWTFLRHNFFKRLPNRAYSVLRFAELGEGRIYSELAERASNIKADLFIGHYPTGLAAAAVGAKKHEALLGYDIEDLHTEESPGESPHGSPNTKSKVRISIIERRHVPACSHLTAVSEPIADYVANLYECEKPRVIHNVFPLSERDSIDGEVKDRKGHALSLYWFSQVIGEDRGIGDVIRAAGIVKQPLQIHLRGSVSPALQESLQGLAERSGVADSVFFHKPVSPDELLSRAAEHDIGLALEQPISKNKELTASNKLFYYLNAGLAVVATDIPGQREIIESVNGGAGLLYKPGDVDALASILSRLCSDSNFLKRMKSSALRSARSRWNWEFEQKILLESVENVFRN